MGKDYYLILGIKRSCQSMDVKRAYRVLALKYHPDSNREVGTKDRFLEVSEAYDVLSDLERRAIYDQFGEEALKVGVPCDGKFLEGYAYHGDYLRTFHEFFGGDNPFADYFNVSGLSEPPAFSGVAGLVQPRQDPPVERELQLSLEEIYLGCTKKMKISRRVMNEDGVTTSLKDKILTIRINPGIQEGTKITFPKEGDQGPNAIPADITFIIRDKKHTRFIRSGLDLKYTARIKLVEALSGCTIPMHTLDGREIRIPVNDIVRPGYTKEVKGEGMPSIDNTDCMGNLIISFDVIFPMKLSEEKKTAIKKIL
ncbi:hypothetical protein LOD99_13420 [Oopsacas minuta]|uniref:J domain-containing protein n=1 Tax=Oopsacas minuta TaxID=111878 RepID=A0AAV7KJK3_9METZ|nr:hypothetical protein LOD99_13420 [Oopsacas minuta]